MSDPVAMPASPRKWPAYIAAAIAALIVIGALAAGLIPWLIPTQGLDNDVAAQIRRTTGFATTVDGQTRLRLFPRPHIDMDNVTFADTSGAIHIDVPTARAYLRLLPLLGGRIELGRATLYEPNIFIALDRRSMTSESGIARIAKTPAADSEENALVLGRVDVVDGHAHIEQPQNQKTDFEAVTLSLDWPSAYASATLSGAATLRGKAISFDIWLSQPIELLRGGQSATTLRLRSDILTLSTAGNISAAPRRRYVGPISADAASLRELAQVAGFSFPRHGTFGNFSMRGDLDLEAGSAAFTNLHIGLDNNDYEGDLAVEYADRIPRFSGTLASDLLDVTPFLSAPPQTADAARGGIWNHHALDLSDLRFADLDIRISASRLRLNDLEIEDAALSVMTKPGLIDLALAEATANQGTVKGRISVTANGDNLDLHVTGSGKNIAIEPMALNLKRPLSGSLAASLALSSTGADLNRLIQGLAGRAEISVTNGALKGIDVVQTLRQAGVKTPGAPIKSVDGSTPIEALSFGLRLSNGLAQVEQGRFSTPGMQLDFAGNTDMRHHVLDLAALGMAPAAASQQATPLKLRAKGSWGDFQFFQGEADLRLPPAPAHAGDLPDDATTYTPPD